MEQGNTRRANRRVVIGLVLATSLMFGFGYALVPIYNVLCEVTGLNGKTADEAATVRPDLEVDEDRTVIVEFVTSTGGTMPWDFQAVVSRMEVHPGQHYEAMFEAVNPAAFEVSGQAVPSVAPGSAARYFQKTECFCFTRQTLDAGEKKMMPVRFVVSPKLPEHIDVLTLSYTFFEVEDELAAVGD